MTLHIQDPEDPNSPLLLEALIEACDGSVRAGGAFAFASASGVKLLLQDEVFERLFANHPFDLIVGVDAITDVKALNAITSAAERTQGITASAFLSDHTRSIFHPKLTWFKKRNGGCLIAGSGNLTNGGLRSNWEGFNVERLNGAEVNAVEDHWNAFKARHVAKILPLDDPRIIEAATQNAARATADRVARRPLVARRVAAPQIADVSSDAILVAEIPQSGNRWKQANFDLHTFQTFFQVRAGAHERVVFYQVDASGLVHSPESRVSVAVRSQNYRFELEAAAGLNYPTTGRPIGVFRRIATRTFYYTLLMPTQPGHNLLSGLLTARAQVANANRMKRIIVTSVDLAAAWPQCPVLIDPLID